MIEVSRPESENEEIGKEICSVPGVITYHNLRTRKNGNRYVLDFHIKVDKNNSIVEAHDISTHVENKLQEKYPNAIVNIHMEPYQGEEIDKNGCCMD